MSAAAALRIDYWPRLAYDDSTLQFNLRVDASADATGVTMSTFANRDDSPLGVQTLAADADHIVRVRLPLSRASNVRAISLHDTSDASTGDPILIRLIYAAEGLPPLVSDRSGWRDADGTRCVLIAQHRMRQLRRKWEPIRNFIKRLKPSPPPTATHLFADLLVPQLDIDRVTWHITPTSTMSLPVYAAVVNVAGAAVRRDDSAMLFLGSRDITSGTAPDEFRVALEVIVQHLQHRGCRDIRFVIPIASPAAAARYGQFRVKTGEVAHIYQLGNPYYLRGVIADSAWSLEGTRRVFSSMPSPAAMQKIANRLAKWGLHSR